MSFIRKDYFCNELTYLIVNYKKNNRIIFIDFLNLTIVKKSFIKVKN